MRNLETGEDKWVRYPSRDIRSRVSRATFFPDITFFRAQEIVYQQDGKIRRLTR